MTGRQVKWKRKLARQKLKAKRVTRCIIGKEIIPESKD